MEEANKYLIQNVQWNLDLSKVSTCNIVQLKKDKLGFLKSRFVCMDYVKKTIRTRKETIFLVETRLPD